MHSMSWGYEWRPYVSVAQRRAQATLYASKLAKKEGRKLCPVQITGRAIADTFWGRAWCENLERYSDFANRLPRGRTYARNGSVVDLQIEAGNIRAIVGGSEVYEVRVSIETLPKPIWTRVKRDCSQGIDSLIDLLQGRFDEGVMKRLTQPKNGLFPQPQEIDLKCSCPDWAVLCKHVAGVLYCVARRLDTDPQLLFTLRGVDHTELISHAVAAENLERSLGGRQNNTLGESNLEEVFGIEIDGGHPPGDSSARRRPTSSAKPAAARKSAGQSRPNPRAGKNKPLTKKATFTKSGKKTPSGKRAGRRKTTASRQATTRKVRQPV
jgi:uncharacterized Zn finger protein